MIQIVKYIPTIYLVLGGIYLLFMYCADRVSTPKPPKKGGDEDEVQERRSSDGEERPENRHDN